MDTLLKPFLNKLGIGDDALKGVFTTGEDGKETIADDAATKVEAIAEQYLNNQNAKLTTKEQEYQAKIDEAKRTAKKEIYEPLNTVFADFIELDEGKKGVERYKDALTQLRAKIAVELREELKQESPQLTDAEIEAKLFKHPKFIEANVNSKNKIAELTTALNEREEAFKDLKAKMPVLLEEKLTTHTTFQELSELIDAQNYLEKDNTQSYSLIKKTIIGNLSNGITVKVKDGKKVFYNKNGEALTDALGTHKTINSFLEEASKFFTIRTTQKPLPSSSGAGTSETQRSSNGKSIVYDGITYNSVKEIDDKILDPTKREIAKNQFYNQT